MTGVKRFMLDTNIFNRVKEGELAVEVFQGRPMFVTHIQRGELENTRNPETRSQLLAFFHAIGPNSITTSSAIWGIWGFGTDDWSDRDGMYEALLAGVKECDDAAGKKKSEKNQQRDAVMAETAIKKGLILVTDDRCLAKVSKEFGCSVMSLNEFKTAL